MVGDSRLKKLVKELKKIRKALEDIEPGDSTSEIIETLGDILGELRASRAVQVSSRDILADILVEERAQRDLLEDILEELRDDDPSEDEIREQLEQLIGSPVEITVDFGTITGTVVTVQEDYTALEDSSGRLTYVPIASINSVAPLEERG